MTWPACAGNTPTASGHLAGSDIYSLFNPANLFIHQQRQRETLRLLRRRGFYPLLGKNVLGIGCGAGGLLLEYLANDPL